MSRPERVTYYAAALTADRKIGQLLVTVEPGQKHRQEWTGVTYASERVAYADLARLNRDAIGTCDRCGTVSRTLADVPVEYAPGRAERVCEACRKEQESKS